jgi:hypothetical protein
MQKKIMVPLGPEIRDLKSVHYALAAAERLQAAVVILRFTDGQDERPAWLEEALTDLVASARLAGLKLTIVEAEGIPEREIVDVADHEKVDLLVLSDDQRQLERGVLELAPRLEHIMIQVREKDTMHLGTEEGGSQWQS